eukprot:gene10136-2301_t
MTLISLFRPIQAIARRQFARCLSASPSLVIDESLYPTIPNTSMKCLKKVERAPGLTLSTAEHPKVRPYEILINVKRTAICGTDVHIYKWDEWRAYFSEKTVPTPMITGHEYSGVVAEIGSDVRGFKVGDRVTGEGHIVCGYCRNCRAGRQHLCRNTVGVGVNRPGAFADYFTLPATNAFKLPPAITDETASIMDPLGNAVHCALSFDLVGEDVLITGAGPIGIMAAAVCRHVGARNIVVTDVNDYRLKLAEQCGADVALNVAVPDADELLLATMKNLGMTEGFDVGLEMSGQQSGLQNMLNSMNCGGRIAILGIPSSAFPIDLDKIVFKGLTVKGIYGREMYETWYKMSNMLVAGLQDRIAPVITHQLPFEQYEEGFEAMCKGEAVKVVLKL